VITVQHLLLVLQQITSHFDHKFIVACIRHTCLPL